MQDSWFLHDRQLIVPKEIFFLSHCMPIFPELGIGPAKTAPKTRWRNMRRRLNNASWKTCV
jgi:hypothetical protein